MVSWAVRKQRGLALEWALVGEVVVPSRPKVVAEVVVPSRPKVVAEVVVQTRRRDSSPQKVVRDNILVESSRTEVVVVEQTKSPEGKLWLVAGCQQVQYSSCLLSSLAIWQHRS